MTIPRLILGFLAAVLIGNFALAADPGAKALVDRIYSKYTGKDASGLRMDQPATLRMFTPGLRKLIDADAKQAAKRNEVPTLDGDPFIDAQDWEIASYTADVKDSGPNKAIATVKFRNTNQDVTITIDLVKQGNNWQIDDIKAPSGSLREALTKK